jgi:hypothetical protein
VARPSTKRVTTGFCVAIALSGLGRIPSIFIALACSMFRFPLVLLEEKSGTISLHWPNWASGRKMRRTSLTSPTYSICSTSRANELSACCCRLRKNDGERSERDQYGGCSLREYHLSSLKSCATARNSLHRGDQLFKPHITKEVPYIKTKP